MYTLCTHVYIVFYTLNLVATLNLNSLHKRDQFQFFSATMGNGKKKLKKELKT